jgi:nucleoid-associated protein YgaU
VLVRASQKFILFWDDGRPVRARLTVTFNEYVDLEREAKKINRQTADFSKVHVMTAGETLPGLAAKFYDDPQKWRPIAIANGLDDPLAVFAGQELLIPKLPFTALETGEVHR